MPILCIHGYSVDRRLMAGCLEPIFAKESGYQRIYLDLPGMGKSPAPDWLHCADEMLEVVMAFIRQVIPKENFLVIGESYGGYLTLGLLCKMKERIDGAFFLCPAVKAESCARKLPKKRLLHVDDELAAKADDGIRDFLDMAVVATPQIYEAYQRDIVPGLLAADASFLTGYSESGYGLSFEKEFENLWFERPATFLTGRQDHIVGYQNALELLERFPRASFGVLDAAGHNLQLEQETVFAAHVSQWLRRAAQSKEQH